MSPSDVEQVVADAQQNDGLQREDGRQVRRKLEDGSGGAALGRERELVPCCAENGGVTFQSRLLLAL